MSSSTKYILAIDHGTSGAKVALVSTRGDVADWAFQEVKLYLDKNGKAEQDPAEWMAAIKSTGRKLIDKRTVPVDDIVGICNSSQWSGTVAVDKDGNHLMNSLIWMDTRGAKIMERLHKGLIKVSGYNLFKLMKWIGITGGGPTSSGKDPIAHILYIKEQLPDIYKNAYKFLEPQDYVNVQLTGKIAASYASEHVHWITDIRDINNITYSKPLMRMLGVDPAKFPELKQSTDVLGPVLDSVASELGLNRGTKVVMGAPDLHAATVGSGAVGNFEGHVCIGTSDWLLCHVPYKKTDALHNMGSLPSAFRGKYMLTNEQELAGGCLSFLRDKVLYHEDELLKEERVPDVYKLFDRMVEHIEPGSNNLIFTPWLFGERGPVDDHAIRGGLHNLSLEMNREHIIRAIFEGVAYNVRWLLMYVEKFINRQFPWLNIIGGGANSNIWCQIFADVLNRPIRQVENPIQANARGAAFIASVALGYLKEEEIGQCIKISKEYKPNQANRGVYDKLFKEFLEIYKYSKKMNARLLKA
jgi:xylulokinase